MAEALAQSILGQHVYVQSAGIAEGERDAFVDAILAEKGLDLGDRKPRVYNPLADNGFDVIVALTPKAHEKILEGTKTSAVEVLNWPIEDPSLAKGRREQILDAYRDVRNTLEHKIKEHFSN